MLNYEHRAEKENPFHLKRQGAGRTGMRMRAAAGRGPGELEICGPGTMRMPRTRPQATIERRLRGCACMGADGDRTSDVLVTCLKVCV